MSTASLHKFITGLVLDGMSESTPTTRSVASRASAAQGSLLPLAEKIADELISQAVMSGLPLTHFQTANTKMGGGNTADVVAQLTLHAPFAFKLDQNERKLAAEAQMMRAVRNNSKLPRRYREAWPLVYAIREEPPYAYLMEFFPKEEGWQSLEDRMFPTDGRPSVSTAEAVRLMHAALDVLFAGYTASVDRRNLPSVRQDYVRRVEERLKKAATLDDRFGSMPLSVGGFQIKPWRDYLALLEKHSDYVTSIAPSFSTVTHGDPNPGNLILRTTSAEVELKLIDPKDWITGDYLFDIAKITHFIQGTGPIEKPGAGSSAIQADFVRESLRGRLDYSFVEPAWGAAVVDACLERVEQFAAQQGDPHWRARYELGMAANLLGLPAGRLENRTRPRPDAALALYGEGLKWLDRFCERLTPLNQGRARAVAVADPSDIEPKELKRVRDFVRDQVPDSRSAQDRRGFQLLQWPSRRSNRAGKPTELSLEHEARLQPANEAEIGRLLESLQASEGKGVGEHFLRGHEQFAALVVRRYQRDTGAQSVDRYYEIPGPENALLIPRMVTLRQRIKTSGFMTWSGEGARDSVDGPSVETTAPLNLELPFVALGHHGMTVRLEFNWIDDLGDAIRDALAPESVDGRHLYNPLYLAGKTDGLDFRDARAVLEHTTYREKFAFVQPAQQDEPERMVFDLNVDHVVAQALETRRIGTYTDVDISAHAVMDSAELERLMLFSRAVASNYALQPVWGTKAWRDATVTGLL